MNAWPCHLMQPLVPALQTAEPSVHEQSHPRIPCQAEMHAWAQYWELCFGCIGRQAPIWLQSQSNRRGLRPTLSLMRVSLPMQAPIISRRPVACGPRMMLTSTDLPTLHRSPGHSASPSARCHSPCIPKCLAAVPDSQVAMCSPLHRHSLVLKEARAGLPAEPYQVRKAKDGV